MSESNINIRPEKLEAGLSLSRINRTIRLGVKSLWLHRLRSLLTALGIVFGVCSVIAMLAIGEGASYAAQEQIKKLGSQNIILQSVKPVEDANAAQTESSRVLTYGLTYADIRRIKATIPGVTVVVPARIMREFVWNINRQVDCEIHGTVPWYPEMRNQRVLRGRFFTDREMTIQANVCVIDEIMAQKLFPLSSPIGDSVRVGGGYYRVVGVMEAKGGDEGGQQVGVTQTDSLVNRMFIPLETATARFGETLFKRRAGSFEAEQVELHEVTVKIHNLEEVVPVSLVIQDLLDANHKKKDYKMTVPLEQLKSAEQTKRIFNIVLGSIAAISLLVGGIGIMNIMLATVTERTREIGIRRALGAKQRDIILQFLIETVILSGTGGIIGVLLGILIPYVVTYFSNMVTIVTLWSPIIAFTISALVGVVFGIYPALRAAGMDPVEALRHE